ncbi:uncharacterized protein LOC117896056 isoform X3 [Drosophila subobscura]|uniref:uncharacterized protein LOC117896056 isoform X3 n=1 Tax=Drosophila subobscura TaxID=7241 RepID=UPI00155A5AF1|nr:uncharacterized protein LOC117896056 isoform X3 [Drosophila subobscura]
MLRSAALSLISVFVLFGHAQRPPPTPPPPPPHRMAHRTARHQGPPPNRDTIYFPLERDILFPDTNGSSELEDKMWYHISDFHFDRVENLPQPKHKHKMPPPRPGQPFPPPPGGFKTKKNRRRRRICEQKYSEYVERIFPNDTAVVDDANDADFDGRILARPGEYPHMAAVGFEADAGQIQYKCGGSLISENFVLTAAHCTSIYDTSPKWVRIGDLNLVSDERTVEPQLMQIQDIFRHPNYTKELYYNDIALLKLQGEVDILQVDCVREAHSPMGVLRAAHFDCVCHGIWLDQLREAHDESPDKLEPNCRAQCRVQLRTAAHCRDPKWCGG